MSLLDRYAAWTGTIEDLEAEIASLTARGGPAEGIEPANARLIRHYQTVGAVDRPARGKVSHYGRRQLLQVLATKAMLADGWTLSKIPEVTGALPDAQLEETALNARSRASAEEAPEADAHARSDALQAVTALQAASSQIADPTARFAYMTERSARPPAARAAAADLGRSAAPVASPATPAAGVCLNLKPAAWLQAYADTTALATCSDAEIDAATQSLARALKANRGTA